jgi:hypothetical protein
MTFLLPGFLFAAGAVSLGVVLLHLLVTQQPRSETLPTVRFVPDVPALSTTVAIRPSDLWLLLLRVIMIMLIGAAFAQPQLKPPHRRIARVLAVDASRAVANPRELADSAQHYAVGARAVVLFDSTAHELPLRAVSDTLAAIVNRSHSVRRGALSPALIAALRAAARVRDAADSIEIVVVSPFAAEEQDAATQTVRSLWPGHIRAIRVAAAADSVIVGQAAAKHVTVQWADSSTTTFWKARPRPDTVGAVRLVSAVLVYPFARRWRLAVPLDSTMRVYARWVDGEPAAVENVTGESCVRSIAIAIPSVGDAILRPSFVRFLSSLSEPCGVTRNLTPLPPEFLTAFEGSKQLAPVSVVKPPMTRITPFVLWLLSAAVVLALLELLVRRSGGIRQLTARVDEPGEQASRGAA